MNIKQIKKFDEAIDFIIKNNPHTLEIITISDVELLNKKERIVVSEIQGNYRQDVIFTAMQKLEVTYQNEYFGIKTEEIIAGTDAIRYTYCSEPAYKGKYLDEDIISVEFVGEYTKSYIKEE